MLAPTVWMRAVVFAEFVAVMPVFRVRAPAPTRMLILAVELLIVRVPTVTSLFTVVLPATERVALSEAVQATPLVPFHQVLPPVQLPLPPAVALPAELQVTLAASTFQAEDRLIMQTKTADNIFK